MNTDQGSQFTSAEWIARVGAGGTRISMDGEERWRDNIVAERFWWSLKHEDVYLRDSMSVLALTAGVEACIQRYNTWRPHPALGWITPQMAYEGQVGNVASSAPPPGGREGQNTQYNDALRETETMAIFGPSVLQKWAPPRSVSKARDSEASVMVRELRAGLGLTQEHFAAKAGVTWSTVNRWKTGRGKPSRLVLRHTHELQEGLGKPARGVQ